MSVSELDYSETDRFTKGFKTRGGKWHRVKLSRKFGKSGSFLSIPSHPSRCWRWIFPKKNADTHTHTEFHRMTSWSGPRKTWHHFLVLGVFDGSPLGRGGADGLEPKKAFPFGSPSLHSAAFVCTLSRTRARIKTSTHTRQTALQMRTEEVRFELLSQTDKNRLSEDSIWNIQSLILSNPWLIVAFCASFTLITELQGWKEKPLPEGNNLHRRSCFKWSRSYTNTAHSLLSWFVWWLHKMQNVMNPEKLHISQLVFCSG